MDRATHASDGTATSVFGSFPVPVAGKTGTAEKVVQPPGYARPLLQDQSWWCGYAPADKPEITVCAVIENGGHGGTAAAPAALKVFEHYFHATAPPIGSIYSD
jgi:penicillin-binding protein 2